MGVAFLNCQRKAACHMNYSSDMIMSVLPFGALITNTSKGIFEIHIEISIFLQTQNNYQPHDTK